MLQENELCLIIVTISSFNQQVLHLRLGAEAFLINALIDSPDDKINGLITDPSKVIFSSLRIAWCTSTNLQSGRSASFSWKRGSPSRPSLLRATLAWEWSKLWSVRIFLSVSFVRFARRCPLTAAILVPWRSLGIFSRCGNKDAFQDAKQRKSQFAPFGVTSYYPCTHIGL